MHKRLPWALGKQQQHQAKKKKGTDGTTREKVRTHSCFSLPLSWAWIFFSIHWKGYTGNLTACDFPPNPLVISVAKKFLELVLSGEWWERPRQ